MTGLRKRLLVIAGIVLLIPVGLYLAAWLLLGGYKDKPSNIVEFPKYRVTGGGIVI